MAKWAIKYGKTANYYAQMTGIGPAFWCDAQERGEVRDEARGGGDDQQFFDRGFRDGCCGEGVPMRARKLKLASGTWRYVIDTDHVTTLRSPSGKRYRIGPDHTFTTCMCSCPPEYQCFGKGFSPGALRRFIEKHLFDQYNLPRLEIA